MKNKSFSPTDEKLIGEIIHHLQKIVQFQSVRQPSQPKAPYGYGVDQALIYFLTVAKKLGFKTFLDPDHHYGYVDWGSGPDIFGIVCHLDVVPAGDLSQWDHNPWEVVMKNGFLYGRGVIDDKGPAIVNLFALYALQTQGVQPPTTKRVRLVLGLAEETDWNSIDHYKRKHGLLNQGYVPDGMWPAICGEKAIYTFDLIGPGTEAFKACGGSAYNCVCDEVQVQAPTGLIDDLAAALRLAEREFIAERSQISIKGRASHGSQPQQGQSAILFLAQAMAKRKQTPILNFITTFFVDQPEWQVRLFSTLEHDDQINSDVSVNLGILRINQQTERLGLDCRVPAHISLKEVQATLEAQAQPFNLKVKLVDHLPGKKINENDPGLNTSLAIYRHYTDDFRPPLTIGGGTYARAFPKLFAFGAAYHLQDMHTANEKVSLDDLYTMFFVYQATVKAFCQA